jgi:hypothetical protein
MESNVQELKDQLHRVTVEQKENERKLAVLNTLKYFGFIREGEDVPDELISAITAQTVGLMSSHAFLTQESAVALACVSVKALEAKQSGATSAEIISSIDEDLVLPLVVNPLLRNYEFVGTVLNRIKINAHEDVTDYAEMILQAVATREAEVAKSAVKVTVGADMLAVPNEDGTTAVH